MGFLQRHSQSRFKNRPGRTGRDLHLTEKAGDSRIIEIYSNDGPGINQTISESAQYNAILDRTLKIIPEESLVGIMLSGKVKTKVVRSTGKGISQHGFYRWRVRRDRFEEANRLSPVSAFMDETIKRWMASLRDEQKKFERFDPAKAITDQ